MVVILFKPSFIDLRVLQQSIITTFLILGCNIVHDKDYQMAYLILQLLDLLFDGRRPDAIK